MSSSSSNCTGIEPNPDVSGIGVRTAIYAQAVLTLVHPILATIDNEITSDEIDNLHQLYLGLLLPGCALVFSSIIQARTFGLSVYHAIIVLNLSWINNASALIFFQFALFVVIRLDHARDLHEWLESFRRRYSSARVTDNEISAAGENNVLAMHNRPETARDMSDVGGIGRGDTESTDALVNSIDGSTQRLIEEMRVLQRVKLGRATKKSTIRRMFKWLLRNDTIISLVERDETMTYMASAHLILFAAFGLWLWFTINHFGDCQTLTKLTTFRIYVPILVTSQPLRILFIILYTISLLPIVNVLFFLGLEAGLNCVCQLLILGSRGEFPGLLPLLDKSRTLYLSIAGTFLLQVYLIVTTELTIHDNKHLLKQFSGSPEADWTFGQTLAVALITIPLIQVWREVRKPTNVATFKKWLPHS